MGIIRRLSRKLSGPKVADAWPVEITDREKALVEKFKPFTMTGRARQCALLNALNYVDRRRIPGAIVECGVWRGGNMMMAKEARVGRSPDRDIYLFDTFAGMTLPTSDDVAIDGTLASDRFLEVQRGEGSEWCYASRKDVEENFAAFGLLSDDLKFREGKVEETLADADALPEQIAILRLDTDWYESTKVEIEVLYPLLAAGGVLIVDDYGHWEGARKAVHEYFGDRLPLLTVVDYTCRMAIKQD